MPRRANNDFNPAVKAADSTQKAASSMGMAELWSMLSQDEKRFVMIFPLFDKKTEALAYLGLSSSWFPHHYNDKPIFQRGLRLRMDISNDYIISLMKKDLETKLLAKLSLQIDEDKVPDNELLVMSRRVGGRIDPRLGDTNTDAEDFSDIVSLRDRQEA